MIVVEIVAYITFLTLIIYFGEKALWLIFLLFSYRFWHGLLSKETLLNVIPLRSDLDYHILIIILALVTYFAVVIATNTITSPILKYIFLLVMVVYTFKTYSVRDVFFFKDILQEHGMWGLEFWKNQLHEIFTSSMDDKQGIFEGVWDKILETIIRFSEYIKGLTFK